MKKVKLQKQSNPNSLMSNKTLHINTSEKRIKRINHD